MKVMEFFFRDITEHSLPSDQDIVKCPFLRNINEPTNFSFSSAAFPMLVSCIFLFVDMELHLKVLLSSCSASFMVFGTSEHVDCEK